VRRILSLVIVGLGLLAPACSLTGGLSTDTPLPNTPIVPPGLTGRLLYTRNGGLWTLRLETGQATQIVPAPELGQVTSARWSPDGTRLAYALAEVRDRRIPVSEIYVLSADGERHEKVLASEGGTLFQSPTWAPDGNQLFVVKTSTGAERIRRIERIDVGTERSEPVLEEVGPFDVDRDGQWLVLARASTLGMSLIVLNLASREERVVVAERQFEIITAPRFEPRSQAIVFSAGGLTARREAPEPPWAALWPALTRSVQAHGLPQDLYSVPIAGGSPRRVAQMAADDPALAPSPDGVHIAILSPDALATIPMVGGPAAAVLVPGGFGLVDWAR